MAYLPFSSYSCLDTHIFLKVAKEAKMEPPTHVDNVRCGGAQILILVSRGASFRISLNKRSPNPSNMVLPPARIMSENMVLLMSISHFKMEFIRHWCRPTYSWPISVGLNNTSWRTHFLRANLYDIPIRKFVRDFWFFILFLRLVHVECHIADFFLDVFDNFHLR